MVNIEHKDVLELLDAGTCTALMERTLADLELGKGVQYLRGVTPLPSHDLLGWGRTFLAPRSSPSFTATRRRVTPPTRAPYCSSTRPTAPSKPWWTAAPSPRSAPAP